MEVLAEYIVSFLFIISLGVFLYLSLQGVTRMDDDTQGEQGSLWERWTRSGLPEKIDRRINHTLHRLLRRVKVAMLKADNRITLWLKKTRTDIDEEDDRIDFSSIIKEKEGR
ncbi:MAG: hypothetical protein KGZ30_01170 [Anaplasmataceae bacterium]|nr:hypothetical protein [Anaplasmataceae bacterium]